MLSYWRSLALSILLVSATATTTNAAAGIDSYSIDGNGRTLSSVVLSKNHQDNDKQQQQLVVDDIVHDDDDAKKKEERRRNLAIVKNSLYQGAKAGKPMYYGSSSGSSTSSSYPKSGKKAGYDDNNTPVSTPIVQEGPVFGPTDTTSPTFIDGSTTTTTEEEETTYGGEEVEQVEPNDDDILNEFFPDEEEEHVPVHHGQNGGHIGQKPTGSSKGGKATPVMVDTWSGIETSEEVYVEHYGVEEDVGTVSSDEPSSWVGGGSATTTLHHASKTGKATLDHLVIKGNDTWSASAKSIKIPPQEEEQVAHPPTSEEDDDSLNVEDSLKPKAEKKPLTEYFIKEPTTSSTVIKKIDSKSGKAASSSYHGVVGSKSAKKEVIWDGSSGWEPSWGDVPSSGKASKDHPKPSDDDSDNDVNDKPYWIYQDSKCTYFATIPENALSDGLELFMNKEACCTKHPDGCPTDDAPSPSDGGGTVPVPSPSDGLLTMEPTSLLGSLVDVASGNEDFSTLVRAVDAAGLVDTLGNEGPFTIFGTLYISS